MYEQGNVSIIIQYLGQTTFRIRGNHLVTVSQKNTIDKVEQRATKLIHNLRKKKYMDRLKELNLMSTEVRRKRGDLITTFKILEGQVDLGRSVFQVNTETRTRGHNLKLVINRARTDYRKYFFTNRVCKD